MYFYGSIDVLLITDLAIFASIECTGIDLRSMEACGSQLYNGPVLVK